MINNRKVIAFIPVRGGSKSIPLKNIKILCGKPLVCWNIEALEACELVDSIIIATDSDAIWDTVEARNYHKTYLWRRSAESASDTASTESVMLEYLHAENISVTDVFMLVQATSPMTETKHFNEALAMYANGTFDSILSCVRNYRFFWNSDGTSMNYDYRYRPRRQNFNGMLMENGAFYINTVSNVLEYENRLCGKIGIYEMPEYTATEIDEPDDWVLMESLMVKHGLTYGMKCYENVKLFICDIDGTLTDGGMYYSENGDELKKFNTRDGMGLQMLHNVGIKTAIITSEERQLNQRRAEKLKVDYLRQGKVNDGKLTIAKEIAQEIGVDLKEVSYIGDDINCLELLSQVGFAACPADACEEVKKIPNIAVMSHKGGEGCVREFCEIIFKSKKK